MTDRTDIALDIATIVGSLIGLATLVIVISAITTAPSTITNPPTGIDVFYLARNPELLAPGLLFVSSFTVICYGYVAHW